MIYYTVYYLQITSVQAANKMLTGGDMVVKHETGIKLPMYRSRNRLHHDFSNGVQTAQPV
jgi:hypothetical protein